ncbi:MAG: ABC transporter permease subunit [Planctomycetes bacterium]|nr:ABC transporter permease subunit [Planctomycetota bacterium]
MRPFGLIGPLAGWELRRLARRGLALRVRLVFLYVLFFVFVLFAASFFYPLPVRDLFLSPQRVQVAELPAFAHKFSLVLLEAQLAAVVAFTPALAAAAVSEEKDRHTLPLLLTTQLSDREIVFGKAAGRTVFVLAAVFGGVPVLSILTLFGGVDVGFLAVGYALTAGSAALCAAIGVGAACRSPDLRSAVVRAYGRAAVLVGGAFVPPCVAFTPFGVLASVHGATGWEAPAAWGYAGGQGLVAVLILTAAARALRLREPTAGPAPVSAYPLPPRPATPPLLRPERAAPRALPPVDDADPVLWKERVVSFRPSWGMPSVARALGAVGTVLVVVLFVGGARELVKRLEWSLQPGEVPRPVADPGADASGWLLMCAGVFAAGRYLLPLAVGLSGAVAGERFRGTLDALLSTPLSRRGVLRAKVQAHVERGWGFVTAATAGTGMAFTADGGVRLGAAAAVLMLAGIGLVIGLGAWLTVRCETDARAFRLLLPFVLLVVGWPVGAWNLLRSEEGVSAEVLAVGLFVAAGAFVVAGAVLWWLAGRELERGA